jgi:uncharacterized protein YbjT (DUF2867 family)
MTLTVLVTGARGKTGRAVVQQLVSESDVEVRAGSSVPSQLQAEPNLSPVHFDWHDQSTWAQAVAGVNAIYLMRPDLEEAEDLVRQLAELSPTSHIVLLSEQSADTAPHDAWVARVESAFIEAAQRWTILRTSWFQQGLTDDRLFLGGIRDQRSIGMPTNGAGISWVDARDVASVAVAAILDPSSHLGAWHTLTGSQSLTLTDVADLLLSEANTAVSAVDQPLAEAVEGTTGWLRHMLESLYGRVQSGGFGLVTDTVSEILGVAPRSLADFIRENRSEWSAPSND